MKPMSAEEIEAVRREPRDNQDCECCRHEARLLATLDARTAELRAAQSDYEGARGVFNDQAKEIQDLKGERIALRDELRAAGEEAKALEASEDELCKKIEELESDIKRCYAESEQREARATASSRERDAWKQRAEEETNTRLLLSEDGLRLKVRAEAAERERDDAVQALREAARAFVAKDNEGLRLILCDMNARTRASNLRVAAERDAERLREALVELVAVKDLKDRSGANAEYLARQPKAWAEARAALSGGEPLDYPPVACGTFTDLPEVECYCKKAAWYRVHGRTNCWRSIEEWKMAGKPSLSERAK